MLESSLSQAAVLVVDDDPSNLDLLTRYLETHDLTILVARDGDSAIKRAMFARPDLILMDVVMPGMDGFEACRRMKASESTREIPVIFMTSLSDTDSKMNGFRVGAVDYVTKPFRQEEVLARVNAHLQIRTLTRQLTEANATLETRVAGRTAELDTKNRQLREAHDLLEQRVAERTGELREANAQLEQQIAERERVMAERDVIHKQLYETARRVGMAEVAAIVLHDIGNALTSISTSAELLQERLENADRDRLRDVVGLLEEHRDDLPGFLLHDDRGKQLIPYLQHLARRTSERRDEQVRLVETMRKNLCHVADIVIQQNAYTGVVAMVENVAPAELVEDALLIIATALERRGVTIHRDLAAIAPITVARHKVVQILVNLISNAINAIAASGRSDGAITVAVREAEEIGDPDGVSDHIVRFRVADNGAGVAAEDLGKLFRYGYTTGKKGHGLGLHGSLLTARDLGGGLTVTSPGPGHGAEFTLSLGRASMTRAAAGAARDDRTASDDQDVAGQGVGDGRRAILDGGRARSRSAPSEDSPMNPRAMADGTPWSSGESQVVERPE